MTTVSSTDAANSTASSSSSTVSSNGASTLGFEDFISLLTKQLTTQDPTAPTDNSQMVAQMAQFSTLSGITQLNTTASSVATKLGSLDNLASMGSSLESISTKLDSILAAQQAANGGSTTA
ncbi:flagellar hook assembly protein FlgD [Novosphingobium sediminicola]|uniref:Basal-body rod modification protein FlgD n=1 Tax=Novosphingobium sediminicola TaxID=563162 RepID=A0A7W6G7P2_9SPHN|nr:flagellar hook capping FlgD N-terminal domain-containing protein [Novosphingobium sediminicola]MBB3956531.1 flagellar basal-body rod modification protein FlgD [Novosphingobium sediminicola]